MHNDYKANIASLGLMALHDHWVELNNIKRQNSDTQGLFFDRTRFMGFLETILREIILQQEISDKRGQSDTLVDEEIIIPRSLSIRLEYVRLLLEVQWFDGGVTDAYIIHYFQTDSGGPYDFMNALFDAPDGKLDIRKVCDASGGSVVKYLQNMGLGNVLGRLFIEKPKIDKTYVAVMKAKNIDCKELSKEDQVELVNLIRNMQPHQPMGGNNSDCITFALPCFHRHNQNNYLNKVQFSAPNESLNSFVRRLE